MCLSLRRVVPQEREQWINEQMVEVPTPQIAEEIGDIVDFRELSRKFFDMFTDRGACLAASCELRTQSGRHHFLLQTGWNVVLCGGRGMSLLDTCAAGVAPKEQTFWHW